ncbi:hypothetical protein BP6252_06223 [Coleophoma cylindrospora]|uniref:tRNA(Ile)-lysidine synthetase n=1 Tax=Coleophoma cylindrospora TaxID=1849047 RepID=A0A3D8RMQ8_9HELO|nr:hypothetical protein BP6252_06223 [Coleophoma cylindrospora]
MGVPSRTVPSNAHAVSIAAFGEAFSRIWRPRAHHFRGGGPINIGLAISGGVDSMALAALCSQWLKSSTNASEATSLSISRELHSRLRLHAFVVDHGVRDGSAVEAQSVTKALKDMGISTKVLTIQWPKNSNPASQANFESLARTSRFQILGKACQNLDIDSLFLAHHRDDQAETVLMRLIDGHRGSGLTGIEEHSSIPECYGMHGVHESGGLDNLIPMEEKPKLGKMIENEPTLAPPRCETGGIRIFRPLLSFPKDDLIATCQLMQVPWFEDHTNSDPTITRRNAIRYMYKNHVFPAALSRDSIISLSLVVRTKVKSRKRIADELFCETGIWDFDTKAGTVCINFPAMSELDPGHNIPSPEQRNIATLLLRRILSLVSPEEHIPLSSLHGTLPRIFPQFGSVTTPLTQGTFTVAGVKFQKLSISPKAEYCARDCSSHQKETWKLSRQPHHSKISLQPSISIPPHSYTENFKEHRDQWTLPWTLYDGRFWIRVKNHTSSHLSVRPFRQADLAPLKTSLSTGANNAIGMFLKKECEKEVSKKQTPLQQLLGEVTPGDVRWTLPAIVGVVDGGGEKILGLPSLGIMAHDDLEGIDWEVRYKKINWGGPRQPSHKS